VDEYHHCLNGSASENQLWEGGGFLEKGSLKQREKADGVKINFRDPILNHVGFPLGRPADKKRADQCLSLEVPGTGFPSRRPYLEHCFQR